MATAKEVHDELVVAADYLDDVGMSLAAEAVRALTGAGVSELPRLEAEHMPSGVVPVEVRTLAFLSLAVQTRRQMDTVYLWPGDSVTLSYVLSASDAGDEERQLARAMTVRGWRAMELTIERLQQQLDEARAALGYRSPGGL